jgi:hypothetical protein
MINKLIDFMIVLVFGLILGYLLAEWWTG